MDTFRDFSRRQLFSRADRGSSDPAGPNDSGDDMEEIVGEIVTPSSLVENNWFIKKIGLKVGSQIIFSSHPETVYRVDRFFTVPKDETITIRLVPPKGGKWKPQDFPLSGLSLAFEMGEAKIINKD